MKTYKTYRTSEQRRHMVKTAVEKLNTIQVAEGVFISRENYDRVREAIRRFPYSEVKSVEDEATLRYAFRIGIKLSWAIEQYLFRPSRYGIWKQPRRPPEPRVE